VKVTYIRSAGSEHGFIYREQKFENLQHQFLSHLLALEFFRFYLSGEYKIDAMDINIVGDGIIKHDFYHKLGQKALALIRIIC
jgi:hypothetical protein